MLTIVITGGIASGKSEVCKYLKSKNIPIFDCDNEAKAIYYNNPSLCKDIEDALNISVFNDDMTFSKTYIHRLFSDNSALAKVESMLFPLLKNNFYNWRENMAKNINDVALYYPKPFVCIESAIILSKAIFNDIYDKVIYVDSPKEISLSRAVLRDNRSEEEILKRMQLQRFDYNKINDYIENLGSLSDLYNETDNCIIRILNEK